MMFTFDITGPCDVGAIAAQSIFEGQTIGRLTPPHLGLRRVPKSDDAAARAAYLQRASRFVHLEIRYTLSESPSEAMGQSFAGMTPEALRQTFASFLHATSIVVEPCAFFDAAAWAGFVAALPHYRGLRHLHLEGHIPDRTQVAALLRAAAKCPVLERLSLDVGWPDAAALGDAFPAFPRLSHLSLGWRSAHALETATAWLPQMPALSDLRVAVLNIPGPVQQIVDGFKRGVLRALARHGIRSLSRFEITAFFGFGETPVERACWALLDPARPCVFQLRDEDHALAAERMAGAPAHLLEAHGTGKRTGTIFHGIFHALRHRQWARYNVLDCFLHHTPKVLQAFDDAGSDAGTHGANDAGSDAALREVLRRVALLPQELGWQILTWWLGGRIVRLAPRGLGRKRARGEIASDGGVPRKRLLLA